jgi:hypothetical protein
MLSERWYAPFRRDMRQVVGRGVHNGRGHAIGTTKDGLLGPVGRGIARSAVVRQVAGDGPSSFE